MGLRRPDSSIARTGPVEIRAVIVPYDPLPIDPISNAATSLDLKPAA